MKLFKRILIILFVGIIISSACETQELKDINVDPVAANVMDPGYLFSYALLATAGGNSETKRGNLFLCSTYIQQYAVLSKSDFGAGDKYLYNGTFVSIFFERAMSYHFKELTHIMDQMKDDPDMVNNLSMARIWRVFVAHRLTDLYGDVPYTEAGFGFIDQNVTPKYDTQESIYAHMLKELEEAAAAFTPAKGDWGVADYLFGSNQDQWKKFANSLMLRLGMRMTKVNPTLAEQWVKKAIAGGVMTSNDDIVYTPHTDGDWLDKNGNSETLEVNWGERASKTFVEFLENTGDPRLDIICQVGDSNTVHHGLPNGYDDTSIMVYEGTTEAVDINIFSYVNRMLLQADAPMIFQTYAEVELLLAEAAERGWGDGDAESHFNAGVKAAMQMYTLYDATLEVSDAEVTAYLAANPYVNGLQQIGEQYWIATWMNFYEGYANWRRTGYPVLTPVNYPGNDSGGQIPRRIRYAESEYATNSANLSAAIAIQGPDVFMTRIWWDPAN